MKAEYNAIHAPGLHARGVLPNDPTVSFPNPPGNGKIDNGNYYEINVLLVVSGIKHYAGGRAKRHAICKKP